MPPETPVPAPELPEGAEQLVSPEQIRLALDRVSREVATSLASRHPLVLAVMRGGVVFAGQLLPLLPFPLDFDYVDATRYGAEVHGGDLHWRVDVPQSVRGRVVLLLDDILDEGWTLAAIRARLLAAGALEVLIAVFADKQLPREKPVAADFIGVQVPDRYVFGYGMDLRGTWRNLPAVYALPPAKGS
ncbi:MAG: hypoxanthine-guanine phosphoribosyltransferase [Burkholderiales bacterium]|nr:hypoxanthine-guanine phosphoribosyltransferase [Burkholderiales bacterium]MDP2397507.1 hypoxanthine-guanine phosphoribosyltransferase [Burkholderiales bacterium]